jgi:AcrR family transcriptional regulator
MPRPDRRRQIAGAVIELVADQGVRAVTHRALDRHLALPPGSTSYYFRTSRALLEAAVDELAARARDDFASSRLRPPDAETRVEEVAAAIGEYVDRLAVDRRSETLARYALAIELQRGGDPAAALVTGPFSTDAAVPLLTALGATDTARAAAGLVSLLEGLLLERAIGRPGSSPAGAALPIGLYLHGAVRPGH